MAEEHVALPSGREILIRPIGPQDGPHLQAAYDRLSPESKYRRFLAPKPHLTQRDTSFLVAIDGCRHVALVAVRPEEPTWIMGVARFVVLPEEPGAAELAVVVGDPFQREGIANALLARLSVVADQLGVTRFRGTMLAENTPAHRMLHALGGGSVTERHNGSVDEIEVALRPGSTS